jgi:acyl-coenzyme A synthetase/AMP-(fatty) acid ligase
MKHPVHQEVPVCAVAFREGAPLDDQGLTRHLNAMLGFKAPRQLFVFRSLPMISHGKPSIREIVRLVAQQDPSWRGAAGS